jgi:hypothetical protein
MAAYNKLLYAVGNNHAGTYYPVALVLVCDLARLLTAEQTWPRVSALEVLLDLCASFEPQPGFESILLPDGSSRNTSAAFHDAALELVPLLRSIADSATARAREKKLVAEILETLGTS